jgi:Ca2+-binding EF-hand superfamily protein
MKVFKHFDEDHTGYIDSYKIRNMLNESFFTLDDAAITRMIEAADTDRDGKIN